MVKISKAEKGKTLYIELSIYPCGKADPRDNLTISCPDKDTRLKTTLSDNGLQKQGFKFFDGISKYKYTEIVWSFKSKPIRFDWSLIQAQSFRWKYDLK